MAQLVIADSEATKQDLVTHYAVQPAKVVVAYPGYDPDLGPIANADVIAAVKRRYGIHGDYFLHIGTLQPRKNLARLLEAFANLQPAASQSQIQLVLAGKRGWFYDELLHQVRRLGLSGRVLFPGYVTHADKSALLSGALAYLFPSLYEGFGFPVLEAQGCGTPLICANSSSLPEVVGDAALLVDPLNVYGLTQAMARLRDDAALRVDLATRGFQNRERFSWRNCAETVMGVLEAARKQAE
jgi:glycosyltransferase involved in cell wall biosynthesis